MSTYEDVTYEVKDGIAVISLNRPDSLNAFTAAMGQGLKRAVADAVADEAVSSLADFYTIIADSLEHLGRAKEATEAHKAAEVARR